MKYKVGDKVRVRGDLKVNAVHEGFVFTQDMKKYSGTVLTIISLRDGGGYYLGGVGLSRVWTDEMLEDVEDEFKLPDKWYIRLAEENKSSLEKWRTSGGITENEGFVVSEAHNHKGYFYHIDSLPSEFKTEITFDQFKKYMLKSEATPVKEEVKFEKGKWYKSNISSETFYYIKVKHFTGSIVYGERICTSEHASEVYIKDDYWDSAESINQALKIGPLTDLSEIQQYLPENHPDKIKKKTKKVEDLKYPDAVHCSSKAEHDKVKQFAIIDAYEGKYYYLIGVGGRREKPWDGACGSNSESRTTYTNYEFSDIIFPEEKVETKPKLSKEELLAEAKRRYPIGTKYICVKGIRKDIGSVFELTNEDKLKFYGSGRNIDAYTKGFVYCDGKWAEIVEDKQKEEIPEYVECIKNSSGFTAGKTYKTNLESTGLHYKIDIDDNGIRNGWASCNFKPSTKEAFDKQEQRSYQGERPASQKEEELVQTGMSQQKACRSCSYYKIVEGASKRCYKQDRCNATGGQHYPKEYIPEKYISYEYDILDFGSIGSVDVKIPESVQWKMPRHIGISYSEEESPLDSSGDIIVKINKTEVKQIKL